MEIREKATYPYPIWGLHDSFLGEAPEAGVREMVPNNETNCLDITYNVTSHNEGVDRLISEGLAKYKIVASCSTTYYQNGEEYSDSTLRISIPFDKVYNRFTVKVFVVAITDINQCNYLHVDELYEGSVDYPRAAVIAYLDKFTVDLKQRNSASDLSKIVKIMPMDIADIKYSFGPERIIIKMPRSHYARYQAISGQCPAIAESNIVYNALVQAIYRLRSDSDETKDWVFYLRQYVKECNEADIISIENEDYDLEMEDIYTIVDRLLEKPHLNAFDEVYRVID